MVRGVTDLGAIGVAFVALALSVAAVRAVGNPVDFQAEATVAYQYGSSLFYGDLSGALTQYPRAGFPDVFLPPGQVNSGFPSYQNLLSVQCGLGSSGSDGVYEGTFALDLWRWSGSAYVPNGDRLEVDFKIELDATGYQVWIGGVQVYAGDQGTDVNTFYWREPYSSATKLNGDFAEDPLSYPSGGGATNYYFTMAFSPLFTALTNGSQNAWASHSVPPGYAQITITGLAPTTAASDSDSTSQPSAPTTQPGTAPGCMAEIAALFASKLPFVSMFSSPDFSQQLTIEPINIPLGSALGGGHISVNLNPQSASLMVGSTSLSGAISSAQGVVRSVATFFLVVSFAWLIWGTLKDW